ncbi:MAG: hypothetical protein F7C32_00460 [Desulfurococcales archaeon]|nr:hypothetical protein [Desulfurococcales archaeon]
MAKKAKIIVGIGKSRSITLDAQEAIELLNMFVEERGLTQELEESIRFIENFDVFYEVARKKHKDYLTPPQDYKALLEGRVVVEKLRLEKDEGKKRVTIIFHRSVPIEEIKKKLVAMGYDDVVIEKISLF